MSNIFNSCISLKSLPDISKWNISKVTNMSNMFDGCTSLKSLPDISKWNTSNVINMSYMFHNCCSINSLPNIDKWHIKKVEDIDNIFIGCKSLSFIPDLSKLIINNKNSIYTLNLLSLIDYYYLSLNKNHSSQIYKQHSSSNRFESNELNIISLNKGQTMSSYNNRLNYIKNFSNDLSKESDGNHYNILNYDFLFNKEIDNTEYYDNFYN